MFTSCSLHDFLVQIAPAAIVLISVACYAGAQAIYALTQLGEYFDTPVIIVDPAVGGGKRVSATGGTPTPQQQLQHRNPLFAVMSGGGRRGPQPLSSTAPSAPSSAFIIGSAAYDDGGGGSSPAVGSAASARSVSSTASGGPRSATSGVEYIREM